MKKKYLLNYFKCKMIGFVVFGNFFNIDNVCGINN